MAGGGTGPLTDVAVDDLDEPPLVDEVAPQRLQEIRVPDEFLVRDDAPLVILNSPSSGRGGVPPGPSPCRGRSPASSGSGRRCRRSRSPSRGPPTAMPPVFQFPHPPLTWNCRTYFCSSEEVDTPSIVMDIMATSAILWME